MIAAIIVLIIFCILFGWLIYIYYKTKKFLQESFGQKDLNFMKIVEEAREMEKERPKNVSSLESIILPRIYDDFPDININEIKNMAEESIYDYFDCIEAKEVKNRFLTDKVKAFINGKIDDYRKDSVYFDHMKVHKTAVNKYDNRDGVATIQLQTALEYYINKNGKSEKVQDRYNTEFIYVIDSTQVEDDIKLLGLNCPNCGAPIKSTKVKSCSYCGTVGLDLVSRSWVLNKIKQI